MCRLLGIVSKKPTNANFWFFDAERPLKSFCEGIVKIDEHSCRGPHDSGWGFASLNEGHWDIFKEGKESVQSYHFDKLKEYTSKLLLVHLRHASVGKNATENAHPFQYGDWVFMHNGGVQREEHLSLLEKSFVDKLTGYTDSEVFFYLIMQEYEKSNDIISAIKKTIESVKKHPYTGLNFLLTNGKKLYVHRDAQENKPGDIDYYSLHYLVKDDQVIISSDPLTNEDNWTLMPLGQLLVIDVESLKMEKIKI